MSTADIAALGTAVFAAVAAGASWASVWQNRKDRIAASQPYMTIDLIVVGDSNRVRVHLTNAGAGIARGVEFAVAAPATGQMSYGPPHPAPLFKPGESRIIETGISGDRDTELIGFVQCYDITGTDVLAWWPNGSHRKYRIGRDPSSAQSLMQVVAPGFDVKQMGHMRRYATVERSLT